MADHGLSTLRIERSGGVLTAIIQNPPINLVNPEWVREIVGLLDRVESDPEIRVLIFESADPDFFIPHVDMTQIAEYTAEAAKSGGPFDLTLGALYRRLAETAPVTIAKITGRTRGAGSEFVLACDMRFAAPDAVFGQPEVGVGTFPGAGAVQYLSRLVGRGNTMEAILGADDFTALDAERIGWVNRVLPEPDLSAFVTRLAHRIAGFPPDAVALAKRRINAATLSPKEDVYLDSSFFQQFAHSEELRRRVAQLFADGLQTRGGAERDFGEAVGGL